MHDPRVDPATSCFGAPRPPSRGDGLTEARATWTQRPGGSLQGSLVCSILGYVRLICRSESGGRPGLLGARRGERTCLRARSFSWLIRLSPPCRLPYASRTSRKPPSRMARSIRAISRLTFRVELGRPGLEPSCRASSRPGSAPPGFRRQRRLPFLRPRSGPHEFDDLLLVPSGGYRPLLPAMVHLLGRPQLKGPL